MTGSIDKLQKKYDVDVRWIAFPLHPETPEDGLSLENLFRNQPVDIEGIKRRLISVAKDLGLPFGNRNMTYNSRSAQEIGHWAETRGKGDAFHHAVFHAYFAEGKNIADGSVLFDLVESIGLPGKEALEVLKNGLFKKSVDADWAFSREMQVTAVPTLIMGSDRLVGAQSYEAIEDLVIKFGITGKKS